MNTYGLAQGQKMPLADAVTPTFLAAIRKPSAACGVALAAYSLTFAKKAIGGRIEEVVQPLYILRTGVF
jgi:hypothetical protein